MALIRREGGEEEMVDGEEGGQKESTHLKRTPTFRYIILLRCICCCGCVKRVVGAVFGGKAADVIFLLSCCIRHYKIILLVVVFSFIPRSKNPL